MKKYAIGFLVFMVIQLVLMLVNAQSITESASQNPLLIVLIVFIAGAELTILINLLGYKLDYRYGKGILPLVKWSDVKDKRHAENQ